MNKSVATIPTPPANNSHLANGLYRNDLGAELHVIGGWITPVGSRVMSIGGIYVAESRDRLFGTVVYHVTPESMRAARYELIEESVS